MRPRAYGILGAVALAAAAFVFSAAAAEDPGQTANFENSVATWKAEAAYRAELKRQNP